MAVTVSFIETPPVVNLQGNPCVLAATSSLENATDIAIHFRIQELVGDVWTDTDKEDAITIVDGAAVFDASGYFEGVFEPAFAFPEHFSNLILPRPGMVKAFRVKVWESYLDESGVLQSKEADSLQLPQTTYMLPGGINEDDQAIINETSSDWWTEHQESGRALNWMPGTKTISPDSIEKIYWIQAIAQTITLRFSWTDTDGNTGTYDYAQAISAYTTYEFSVSPAIVQALTEKEIAGYTVSLVGKLFSQEYKVERKRHEWNEFFMMQNSFLCYECIWCRGARTGKVNFDRQKYQEVDRKYMRYLDRMSGNIRTANSKIKESNTGFFGDNAQSWIDWTVDLLNTGDAWKVEDQKLFPITLNSDSVDTENQLDDTPRNLTFEWEYSRKGKYWSNMGIIISKIIPPYFFKLSAFFTRAQGAVFSDILNGYKAQVSGSDITFPEITGNDLFDFSDATYWDQTLIAAEAWYDSENPRTCPLQWVQGWAWAEAATDLTHARLFHHDYNSKLRDLIPTLVYGSSLPANEQQVVVDWLEWYFTIFDSENVMLLDSNSNVITTQSQ